MNTILTSVRAAQTKVIKIIIFKLGLLASVIGNGVSAGTLLSNGTVVLGVTDYGNLIYQGTGLTYVPTNAEALVPGCLCEGWGVADKFSDRYGKAGEHFGKENVVVEEFITDGVSAKSVVIADKIMRVSHAFEESVSQNLFRVKVSIENISTDTIHLLYRRTMDWDIPPQVFSERVKIVTNGADDVVYVSDNGFADGNPLKQAGQIKFSGEGYNQDPVDNGSVFDFDFGNLKSGELKSFTIYYGASVNDEEALDALTQVGAEVYSLGMPNPNLFETHMDGSPNTFIFGFSGVGGTAVRSPLPDLTLGGLKVIDNGIGLGFSLETRIANAGAKNSELNENIVVSFYDGSPEFGGILLGTKLIENLSPGTYRDVVFDDLPDEIRNQEIYASVDHENDIVECDEGNNTQSTPLASNQPRASVTVETDKKYYDPNSLVQLLGRVSNVGFFDQSYQGYFVVEDLNGSEIERLPLNEIGLVGTGSTAEMLGVWDSSPFVSGSYRLRGVVTDLQGNKVSESTSIFQVGETFDGQTSGFVRSHTSQPQYHVDDIAIISSTFQNLSTNSYLENISFNLKIKDPSGKVVYENSYSLDSLSPLETQDTQEHYILQNALVGKYIVSSTLTTEDTGVVAVDSSDFYVFNDPVKAIAGAVTLGKDSLVKGDNQTCHFTATNIGAADISVITLRTSVVDFTNGMVIQENDTNGGLIVGSNKEIRESFSTFSTNSGVHACVLSSVIGEDTIVIAKELFEVIEPPVSVTSALSGSSKGRLLLLTDESRECSGLEDVRFKVNWGGEFHSTTQLTITVYDKDGLIVDTEFVNLWGVEFNNNTPFTKPDLHVQALVSGDIEFQLSAPEHKLGHRYRVEVEAQRGWFYRETKSWDLQTDCDRPFTVGEIIEDVHLLGYKWFHDPSDSVKDLDPYGPVSAPLLTDQNAFLQSQLDNRGWEYTLVHTAHEFTKEMRNGDYSAYVILSERAHLPVLAQKELREHVFAGKGLVMAGSHDKRNLFVEPALGLTVTGRHPWATGLQNSADEPLESFPFHHMIQTVSLHGANVEAEYSLIADDLTSEELQQGWENLNDAIPLFDHIRNYRRRAVMTTDYGLGRSTFMGYDALAVATELGEQSESSNLLFNHIGRVASIQPQAIAFKEWPVVVTISNEGSAVTGTATLTLPEGMDLVSTGDFEQDGNVWVMNFALDEAANGETTEYQKTVYVRLPQGDGAQAINLYVDAIGENGGQAIVQANLEVSSTQAATMDELKDLGHTVKHNHWYEPHFYILYADLLLAKTAVEDGNWWAAQTLLVGASNLILSDSREDVMQLRLAIDEQIRLIGKQL